MVSPSCYPDGRRYSRLDPPYVYSDRQQRYSTTSEARTSTMSEREPETDTPPRKRIAVACGRCRKRKIRCSGDTGNGMPCQNCKAAGADNCMFLRVASTEAPWVQPSEPFGYEMKAARTYQAQHALASPLTASPQHYASDLHNGLPRHGGYPPSSTGYSSYGAGKYYSTMPPSWPAAAGYADDGTGVDYSAMGYSYPYQSQEAYLYRMTAAKAAPSAGDLYVNTDATGYGYGGGAAAALVHRPAAPADAPSFSLSNVAASLPHAGGDRLLPNPASRLPGTTNVLAYRTDASASSYATSSSAKSSGTSSSHTSPTSAVSDVPASYDSSPVSAYPPASHTLPSMTHIHRLSGADMSGGSSSGYPPSTASSGDSIFSASETSLRTHGSSSELSYKYSDASSSNGSSGRRGSGETSSSGGSLSNGQQYTVTAPTAMYAAAVAGHGRHHHHIGAYALLSDDVEQQQHHSGSRRSVGGLSAA